MSSIQKITWFPIALIAIICVASPTATAQEPMPVTVQGEHLYRGQQAVRFWGINCNLQPWETTQSIDAMARRMNEMGFNAVRAWPNGSAFYGVDVRLHAPPQGLKFADYKMGDGSLLDLYDRLLADLKKRGMGVYCPAIMFYPPYQPEFVDIVQTSPQDRQAWIDAIRPGGHDLHYNILRSMPYLDERVQAIFLAHAANFLNHVNKYTGLRNADDNNIVIWDLSNENHFLWDQLLGNKFRSTDKRAFPLYFAKELTLKWNQWLLKRYGDTQKLRQAWGQLNDGESLEQASVEPGTADPQSKTYPTRRRSDFIAFGTELVQTWNQRLVKFVRGFASSPDRGIAVAPINVDTFVDRSLAYFATEQDGTSMAAGAYPCPQQFGPGGPKDSHSPFFPWAPLVSRPFQLPMFDSVRPADKPMVIYETNFNAFGLYRAEYPWVIATYISWQDYSAVFWYNFNHPLVDELPDPYGKVTFAHREDEIWGDEVICSALSAAGEAFKNGLLPVAASPTHLTFGRQAVINPAWQHFTFDTAAAGGVLPRLQGLSPDQAKNLRALLPQTAFTQGIRVAVSDSDAFDLKVDGPLGAPDAQRGEIEPAPGVKWQWDQARLILDTPMVKACIGFQHDGSIEWSGGFAVHGLTEPFVAIGLVSLDGQPLERSRRIRLSAVSHSQNQTMHQVKGQEMIGTAAENNKEHTTGTTVDPGTGPIIMSRLGYELSLPPQPGRQAILRDFTLREIGRSPAEKSLKVDADAPIFDILLSGQDATPQP